MWFDTVLKERACERFVSSFANRKPFIYGLVQIIQFLEEHKFLLENSDGQSYDDASNMKGSEQGQPGFLKSINKYAYYVPCANHSLNFVGEKLFFTVPEVID